ncbi:MAG: hypothetical protein KDA27_10415 [Candidatus Eisenbacteria bacterium]|uniref:Uncharacterized protein n=1 Tax=Eiseniibacteriota bacterium TaxID=2212470 RepID=A0A956NCC8_UNCEI|nr:hypothetical protein [Candidatus Eisenbacteria bacterium]MCB9462828.1 hypothetical protein [Candidatus Eisenbacteria bacterium]
MTTVHVLLAAKGADAVAITALGALQTLLGFGDTLRALERRRIFELTCDGDEADVVRELESYLQRTFEFWNPNKERCWIRTDSQTLEVVSGQAPRSTDTPGEGGDHLLLWTRPEGTRGETTVPPTASDGMPRDFPANLGGRSVTARRGEVYTFRWADTPDETERRERIDRAGAVRTRGVGLLVQPQYQLWQVALGALPWPVWETAGR